MNNTECPQWAQELTQQLADQNKALVSIIGLSEGGNKNQPGTKPATPEQADAIVANYNL